MELQQEHTENTLLTYFKENEYNLSLDEFISIIPINTIIDIFDIILCIYVHFQHHFWNLSKTKQ